MELSDEAINVIADAVDLLKAPPAELLSQTERQAGFTVLGPYIDEDMTPVPEYAFVRYWWIIGRPRGLSTMHSRMKTQLQLLIGRHRMLHPNHLADFREYIDLRLDSNPNGRARDDVQPDVAVYQKPIEGIVGSAPRGAIPIIAIEILSESTAKKDLGTKRAKYQRLGVPHYWILEQTENPQEGLRKSIFLELEHGAYKDISDQFIMRGRLQCNLLVGLDLDPRDIWTFESDRLVETQWVQETLRAERERQRAEKEQHRAEALEKELEKIKKRLTGFWHLILKDFTILSEKKG